MCVQRRQLSAATHLLYFAATFVVIGCGADRCAFFITDTFYESGMVVRDTIDVKAVFQSYINFVSAGTDTFPDGTTEWIYVGSSSEPRDECLGDVSIWKVTYRFGPDTCDCIDEVFVDARGRILRMWYVPPH
jgi:hypothetical protein